MRISKRKPRIPIFKNRLPWAWMIVAIALNVGLAHLAQGAPIDSVWNASSGNWSDGADWSDTPPPTNNVPNNGTPSGAQYNVTVSSGTITLDISPTIQQLNMSGGSIAGTGTTLTLNDVFTWTGGTIGNSSSSQILNVSAGMNISSGVSFLGGTINNTSGSTVTWTSGQITATGNDTVGNNTTFTNQSGANFNVQCDALYDAFSSTATAPDVFNNAGTFTKSVTTGTTDMIAEFNNSNTVNVQTGTFALDGGGTQTGSFTISSGATLQIGGTYQSSTSIFQSGSSVGGAGNVVFLSSGGGTTATFNTGATYNPTGTTTVSGSTLIVNGATLNLSGGFTQTAGETELTGGTLSSSTTLQFNGGVLAGSGTINAPVTFTGGSGTQLAFSLNGTTPGGHTNGNYDQINVAGDVTLGGDLEITRVPGFNPTSGEDFIVLTVGAEDTLTGSFLNVANGGRLETTDDSGSFLVNYGSGAEADEVLLSDYISVIPEPTSFSMLVVLASGLMMRRRRRSVVT